LILILVVVVLITIINLFSGLRGGSLPDDGSAISREAIREAARVLRQDTDIPQEFFEDGILRQFNAYTNIEAPNIFGRPNPFLPTQGVDGAEGAEE